MRLLTKFLTHFLIVLHLHSSVVFSQRSFVNPAVTDPAPCACDVRANNCDPNCCCDTDCTNDDLSVSPICNSVRTTSSYSVLEETSLYKWNCSNNASATDYDYFPFVCVQLGLNEIVGKYYPTRNITFVKSGTDATNIRTTFVSQNPELFQSPILSSSTTRYSSRGAPVLLSGTRRFTLPGISAGGNCQDDVPVLFGVNRDVTCRSTAVLSGLCSRMNNVTSVLKDGQSNSNESFLLFSKNFANSSNSTRNLNEEYYFQDSYSPTIAIITPTAASIYDYCPSRHPLNRTQRYFFCNTPDTSLCDSQYQTFANCSLRDNLKYTTIPDTFFNVSSTSRDNPTNFVDFDNSNNVSAIVCSLNGIRRVFYRFNYSSTDNTISTVEVFVLLQTSAPSARITIEWNDIVNSTASSTTIPRSYQDGEVLQFRRNGVSSDVSTLVPTTSGLCIDATRQSLRYKKGTSSSCLIQLNRQTVRQCHDLKLNMYLYLNAFYAPASDVLAYPSSTATLIKLRDDTQESIDLDRIDETRPNNRLNQSYIQLTMLKTAINTIYDAERNLAICFDVPSGIYVEFGFVRVAISSTVSYERIVAVQFNYTFSNWKHDCTGPLCNDTSTQRYPVTFQSAFVDYTNQAFYRGDTTRSDLTSADNYIQHLLWLISPEYKGEPAYRNYTIAMILIFIAISAVVMHVLIFGIMCPI